MSITHRVKRTLATAAAAAMVLSLMPVGAVSADEHDDPCDGAPETAFDDAGSIAAVHLDNVQCMAAYGITEGFEDGSFGPGEPVTRQQMASFISRLATQALFGNLDIPDDAPDVFEDVLATNTHFAAINWLADLGVTTGVTETTYEPGENVTREQMASFIARAHEELGVFDEIDTPDTSTVDFSDIDDASDVHRPNIELLAAVEVIGGFEDGTFRPGEDVTRQQMSRFIVESIRVLDSVGLWNGVFFDPDTGEPIDPEPPVETPDTPTFDLALEVDPAEPTAADVLELTLTLSVDDEDESVEDKFAAVSVFAEGTEDDAVSEDGVVNTEGAFANFSDTTNEDGVVTFSDIEGVPAGEHTAVIWAAEEETNDSTEAIEGTVDVLPLVVAPAPTNQTFTVTSDETQVPIGTDIEFTADVGDAEEVRIFLLDADDVDVDNGTVTLETDDDGDAELNAAATAVITDVDGVAVTANDARTVEVEDGEVTFTASASDNESFVALVATLDDDDEVAVDEDGAPEDAFGVSDVINVQNVDGIALLDADRDAVTIFGVSDPLDGGYTLRPEEETVNVTALLFDDTLDLTDEDSIAPAQVAVDGTISWVVSDGGQDAGTDPGSVAGNNVVASGTADVTDGVAQFSFEGGEDGDQVIILAEWTAVEDSVYDDANADGQRTLNPGGTDDHGKIEFTDDDAIGTSASFVDGDDQFVEVDSSAVVQVEVTDQFGNPASGVSVEFNTDGTGEFNRTTNASGVASFAFSESDNGDVAVTATIAADADVTAEIDPVPGGPVTVFFYEDAPDGVNDGDVLFLSGDSSWVVIDDGTDFLRIELESGQLYDVDGATTFAGFIDALETDADLDPPFDGGLDNSTELMVDANYGDDEEVTTYTLTVAQDN